MVLCASRADEYEFRHAVYESVKRDEVLDARDVTDLVGESDSCSQARTSNERPTVIPKSAGDDGTDNSS
jgi:hypothetical protein